MRMCQCTRIAFVEEASRLVCDLKYGRRIRVVQPTSGICGGVSLSGAVQSSIQCKWGMDGPRARPCQVAAVAHTTATKGIP